MSRGGSYLSLLRVVGFLGVLNGYPVNITGGSKPDFIGHGTEYVARKADGGAFIVPFSTPTTKSNPGSTSQRINEAKANGFNLPEFSQGGDYNSLKAMIKEHEGLRLNKYNDSKGYPTIGYGHLVRPSDNIPNTISKAYADKLFDKDYSHVHLLLVKSQDSKMQVLNRKQH